MPSARANVPSKSERSVEERALSAGVQVGSDLDRASCISRVEELDRQDGERLALGTVAVRETIGVRDGGHASQTHVDDILASWLLDIEHVGDLYALPASGGDHANDVAPVRNDPFPFETYPLACIAAQHSGVSAYPLHLAPPMLRDDRLRLLSCGSRPSRHGQAPIVGGHPCAALPDCQPRRPPVAQSSRACVILGRENWA